MLLLADCLLLVIVHVFYVFVMKYKTFFFSQKLSMLLLLLLSSFVITTTCTTIVRVVIDIIAIIIIGIIYTAFFVYCYRPSCLQRILFFCYLFPLCDIRIKQVLFIKEKRKSLKKQVARSLKSDLDDYVIHRTKP